MEVPLNDNEYLVTIKGAVAYYNAQKVVATLTFVTNMRPHGIGPFGNGPGTKFSLPVLKGKIGGLFGRCNDYVDAIGISLVPDHVRIIYIFASVHFRNCNGFHYLVFFI